MDGTNIQEPQTEYTNQQALLRERQSQTAERGQRQDQHGDVGGDVTGSVLVGQRKGGNASDSRWFRVGLRRRVAQGQVLIPVRLDWKTCEYAQHDLREAPEADGDLKRDTGPAHAPDRQHAVVLRQQRQLGRHDGRVVP